MVMSKQPFGRFFANSELMVAGFVEIGLTARSFSAIRIIGADMPISGKKKSLTLVARKPKSSAPKSYAAGTESV